MFKATTRALTPKISSARAGPHVASQPTNAIATVKAITSRAKFPLICLMRLLPFIQIVNNRWAYVDDCRYPAMWRQLLSSLEVDAANRPKPKVSVRRNTRLS